MARYLSPLYLNFFSDFLSMWGNVVGSLWAWLARAKKARWRFFRFFCVFAGIFNEKTSIFYWFLTPGPRFFWIFFRKNEKMKKMTKIAKMRFCHFFHFFIFYFYLITHRKKKKFFFLSWSRQRSASRDSRHATRISELMAAAWRASAARPGGRPSAPLRATLAGSGSGYADGNVTNGNTIQTHKPRWKIFFFTKMINELLSVLLNILTSVFDIDLTSMSKTDPHFNRTRSNWNLQISRLFLRKIRLLSFTHSNKTR